MKKTIAILSVLALMAFTSVKFITVRFTEPQINYHWNNLNAIKQVIDKSNIPHNEAVSVIKAIDSLQKDISLNAKIDSLTNKK